MLLLQINITIPTSGLNLGKLSKLNSETDSYKFLF